VWLAGLALSFASILASQYVTGRTVLRLPRCEDEGWLAALAAAKERFGLGRSVGLRLDGGRSPYSAGILRSVIAVPGSGRSWSQERKLAVMLHEAGHIRRGDTALLFIARLLAALVWPLPLAGLLLSRMAGDREEACDELALGHGADPLVFAELVLELATAKRPRPLPSALGMGQGSNIERRIIMILGHGIDRRKRGRGAAAGGLMALAILAFGVALIPSAFAEAPEAQERGPTGGDRISLASFDPASGVTNRSYDPATLPLGLPLAAGNWQLTQAFGEGPNPLTGKPYMHRGVDISDHRSGDPVLATFAGTVLDSGFEASAGYFVVLGNGAVSAFFSHLEKPGPAKGQRIEAGGLIGTVGLTGVATGPHLHYEVRVAGSFVDPLPLINARATILAGR
jgi:murein DD-endopeptidase MepM/ murein hydrolase activator NlpD